MPSSEPGTLRDEKKATHTLNGEEGSGDEVTKAARLDVLLNAPGSSGLVASRVLLRRKVGRLSEHHPAVGGVSLRPSDEEEVKTNAYR